MWALPEIVVLMPIIWKVWVKNMMAIFYVFFQAVVFHGHVMMHNCLKIRDAHS